MIQSDSVPIFSMFALVLGRSPNLERLAFHSRIVLEGKED